MSYYDFENVMADMQANIALQKAYGAALVKMQEQAEVWDETGMEGSHLMERLETNIVLSVCHDLEQQEVSCEGLKEIATTTREALRKAYEWIMTKLSALREAAGKLFTRMKVAMGLDAEAAKKKQAELQAAKDEQEAREKAFKPKDIRSSLVDGAKKIMKVSGYEAMDRDIRTYLKDDSFLKLVETAIPAIVQKIKADPSNARGNVFEYLGKAIGDFRYAGSEGPFETKMGTGQAQVCRIGGVNLFVKISIPRVENITSGISMGGYTGIMDTQTVEFSKDEKKQLCGMAAGLLYDAAEASDKWRQKFEPIVSSIEKLAKAEANNVSVSRFYVLLASFTVAAQQDLAVKLDHMRTAGNGLLKII